MTRPRFLLHLLVLLGLCATSAPAEEATEFFQQKCKACHTIGGGQLVGPDLKDVTQRKDEDWLKRFMMNPSAMIESGDPYAMQLQKDARGLVMPAIPGLDDHMAHELLEMITKQSQLSGASPAETKPAERPFTPADIQMGAEIFDGTRRLSAGGPACSSCHTTGALQGMGGGRLGPDLTLVFARLGGRQGIEGWLAAPPTPTMQAVFAKQAIQPEEIISLAALFENTAKTSQPADSSAQVKFFVAGLAGVCIGLALMGWIWRKRFRNVRRNLIQVARGAE